MSIRVYPMISHNHVLSFLLFLTFSLVYGSLLNNFPDVYSQVFEIDENDYFEFDDSTSNTNSPSEEFAKKESSDEDEDNDEDKKSKDKKKSKKKYDNTDYEDEYTVAEYSGKYDKDAVQQHYIQKYYLNGTFISSWGTKGTGDGQFIHPHNIAVDSKGNVYVTDERRSDVQKFDSNGNYLLSWGAPKDPNLFSHKMEDVNIDKDGNVWVVDWGMGRMYKFDPNGKLLMSFGKRGDGEV